MVGEGNHEATSANALTSAARQRIHFVKLSIKLEIRRISAQANCVCMGLSHPRFSGEKCICSWSVRFWPEWFRS